MFCVLCEEICHLKIYVVGSGAKITTNNNKKGKKKLHSFHLNMNHFEVITAFSMK